MKSKQQAKLKLEAHITAGQLTAPVLISMFPQFSRATIYNKINHFKKFGSHSRQNLMNSLPSRINLCISADGETIKYRVTVNVLLIITFLLYVFAFLWHYYYPR